MEKVAERLVIITSAEDVEATQKRYPNFLVLSVSQIGGLEFENVIITKALLTQIFASMQAVEKLLAAKDNLAKYKDLTPAQIAAYENLVRLMLAVTRAKKSIFLEPYEFTKQSKASERLNKIISDTSKALPEDLFSSEEAANKEEFLDIVYRYLREGREFLAKRFYDMAQKRFADLTEDFGILKKKFAQSQKQPEVSATEPEKPKKIPAAETKREPVTPPAAQTKPEPEPEQSSAGDILAKFRKKIDSLGIDPRRLVFYFRKDFSPADIDSLISMLSERGIQKSILNEEFNVDVGGKVEAQKLR
ncbi:MAG: hypothetical protein EBU93_06975, partial [Chlamydiae bacterium]|nr:hypothetical protein [Chlamydiota bacterium]